MSATPAVPASASAWRNLRGWGGFDLLRSLPRLDGGFSAALLGVSVAAALAPLATTVVTGLLVGAVPGAVRSGLGSAPGRQLLAWLAAISLLFVAQQLLGPLTTLVRARLQHNVDTALRQQLLDAATTPAGIALIEDPAFQDQVGLAKGVGAAAQTPGRAAGALAAIATRCTTVAGAALILATFNWWLALLVLGVHAYLYARLRSSVRAVVTVYVDQSQDMRRATYLRELTTTPPAAKEVRVFAMPGWVLRRQRESWMRAIRHAWEVRSRGLPTLLALLVLAGAACAAAFLLLGQAALRGAIPTSALVIYASATLQVSTLIGVGDDDQAVDFGLAALPALRRVQAMAAEASATTPGGRRDVDRLPAVEVRFEDVSFRYPGADHDVYSGLDLAVRAGESLAIVGANGAGKTTLVKLLARLYEPTAGRITVDGIDLRELDPAAWQRRVAAIFQDFVRFPLSARENVEAGAVERAGDEALLARAAREAGLDEIVATLPEGWDTVLSREFKGGADLSGGQWQRVALARALYGLDAGAGILVMDEPTANLDVRAEAAIFNRLLEFARGRTTVLVSHRFSTVRRADRICVLSGGRIIEDGTHAELVVQGGEYAAMFKLQAMRFQPASEPSPAEDLVDA